MYIYPLKIKNIVLYCIVFTLDFSNLPANKLGQFPQVLSKLGIPQYTY